MNVCEAYSRDMCEHITRVPLFISARISLDTEAANPFIHCQAQYQTHDPSHLSLNRELQYILC